ncbi:PTS sugar transporter subunit IIA [Paucisalibacillus sp. EB02]|uniref:PTS sugar transporter subunit IIA n=1 Tax=Paucisalibacillus sp. EB02 TaxID=1347087 RepID=UPI0004AD0017|nr:PTS sugar transporter subunit IIA [Paucisalibacillus sp. EB02]
MENTIVIQNYIPFQFEGTNRQDFLESVAKLLFKKGYVKETFFQSICKREEKYPTGIMLGDYGIAIPHTECEHIFKSSIVVTYSNNPIPFQSMENPKEVVPANIVLVLALKEPEDHLASLSKLMELLQQESIMKEIKLLKTSEELTNLIISHI